MTPGPVAVIGLGLIGGSLARALHARGVEVRGWTEHADDRRLAGEAGLAVTDTGDAAEGIAAAVRGASEVVLAVPPGQVAATAALVLDAAPHALVLHVAGIQRQRALAMPDELSPRVFGTHPLAGSHLRGFAASRADLFRGCRVSLEQRLPEADRPRARAIWEAAGAAHFDLRDADAHDALMTTVSHLPQLVATALAATLSSQGVAPADAGPGARDTTRLAASPYALWDEILPRGGDDLEIALAAFQGTLAALARAIARGDRVALGALWERGRAWRTAAEPSA